MTESLTVNNATVAHYELDPALPGCYELARIVQSDGTEIKIVAPQEFSWSGCMIEDEDFYALAKKEPGTDLVAWNDFFKVGRRGRIDDIDLLRRSSTRDYFDGRRFLNDIRSETATRLAQTLEKAVIENRVCLQKEEEYPFSHHLQFLPPTSPETAREGTWKIVFTLNGYNQRVRATSITVTDIPFVSGFVVYSFAFIPESLGDLIDQIPDC